MKPFLYAGCWILLLSVLGDIPSANPAKILAVSFFSSRSHKNVYEPLLFELADRGHSLTVVSSVKSSRTHKNIKEIIGIGEADVDKIMDMNMFEMKLKKEVMNPFKFVGLFSIICNSYYEMPEVKELLKQKFDLIIGSSFMNECTYGLIHHLNTTSMLINPFSPFPWTAAITGSPSPPSFVPLALLGSTDRMDFKQRSMNFFFQAAYAVYSKIFYLPKLEAIYREHLGENTPSISEIERNISLLMTNSHFSLNYPRPFMPDVVEVGGMHCRPGKELPQDLAEFLNGAGKDGFIYFSMGSVIKAKTMPEEMRKTFVNAFSRLKQRVLWKWETGHMDDLPKNVKLSKWVPQQDVLAHPNIRLFITHGGLLSIEEAIYHGVPVAGIPIFGDQEWNMKQSESNGFALAMELSELTEERIIATVTRILSTPKFTQRAKELSVVFKDRPQKPLETALFWTEYIMKHKGASHLRSPSRDLNIFQYHSIDVIALVVFLILALFYTIFGVLRLILRKICGSNKKVSAMKKRN